MKLDLSIIIVTYNSQDTIYACIKSVLDTIKQYSFEIIVSDNSRNNQTKQIVNEEFKGNNKVHFLQNESNLGFSKGNNVGVKISKGKFLLFLNPDTKVYEETIDGMMDFMKKNPDCGAATCFMELPNGILDDSSHRGFPTPWRSFSHFSGLSKVFSGSRLFGGYNLSYLDISRTHQIESLAGSFMLVPRDVGEKLKWWDEDYFFYGEDIDFCYRIKKAGYKIFFVPEFKSLHMKGISSGIQKISRDMTKASLETKLFATKHRFLAMKIFYNKHYKVKYPKIINYLVFLGINLKENMTLRSLKKNNST